MEIHIEILCTLIVHKLCRGPPQPTTAHRPNMQHNTLLPPARLPALELVCHRVSCRWATSAVHLLVPPSLSPSSSKCVSWWGGFHVTVDDRVCWALGAGMQVCRSLLPVANEDERAPSPVKGQRRYSSVIRPLHRNRRWSMMGNGWVGDEGMYQRYKIGRYMHEGLSRKIGRDV
jgi:hypothetical protein